MTETVMEPEGDESENAREARQGPEVVLRDMGRTTSAGFHNLYTIRRGKKFPDHAPALDGAGVACYPPFGETLGSYLAAARQQSRPKERRMTPRPGSRGLGSFDSR